YSRLLEREYRIVNPDDSAHLLQAIRQGRVGLEEALREVDRKLAEDPACLTAHSLRRQIAALKARHPSSSAFTDAPSRCVQTGIARFQNGVVGLKSGPSHSCIAAG